MKEKDAFGSSALSDFAIGDLVTWKKLGNSSKFGIIKEVYLRNIGGRPVAYARVFLLHDSEKIAHLCEEEVIIMNLKLLSKREI